MVISIFPGAKSVTLFFCFFWFLIISVADPGCLSRIPIRIFPSQILDSDTGSKDSGSASNNLSIFNPKTVSKLSGIWSGSWFLDQPGSRIRGSKRHSIPDTQHCMIWKLKIFLFFRTTAPGPIFAACRRPETATELQELAASQLPGAGRLHILQLDVNRTGTTQSTGPWFQFTCHRAF